MLIKRIGAIILTVVLSSGLQSGFANAEPLHTMVFSDGREITMPETKFENGAESYGQADPWQGTELSVEELVSQGVIIKSYPDVEALLALESATSDVGIEMVIGVDTRTRTYTESYPARAVALIRFNDGSCTGWLIGPDTVVTAGHCVHTGGTSGYWRSGFTVYPGYDQNIAPYGVCGATWAATNKRWAEEGEESHDYGVIKLDCDIGITTGYFGFLYKEGKNSMKGFPTAITGYPGDKPFEQWQSHDKVRASKMKMISYDNDTYGGMSGSPVWYDKGKKGPYAIGIHTAMPHGSGFHGKRNHGTRIHEVVFNMLSFWNAEPKE